MLLGMQQILFWLSQVSENPNPNPNPSDEWHCYVWGSGHAYSVADMANLNYHINLRFFFVFVRWETCGVCLKLAMLKLACVSCVFFEGCVWDLFCYGPEFSRKRRSNILGSGARVECDHTRDTHQPLHFPAHEELHHLCSINHSSYCSWVLTPYIDLALWFFTLHGTHYCNPQRWHDHDHLQGMWEPHIPYPEYIYIYAYMRNKFTIFPVLIGRCMSCESLVLMACLIVHYYQESRT